ncbi:MAG: APC family permease, partial [Ktedonobacteraceae bacterium]
QLSGRFQQILTFTLVALLGLVSVVSLFFGNRHNGTGLPPISHWSASFPLLGLIFFAYTGWELLSSTTEEFRNPKRDFPITVIGSFLLVTLLYFLIALAIQFTLSPTNPFLKTAPIAGLLFPIFGQLSGQIVAALGVGIITANLIGGIWAASRLLFSSAREGLLPSALQRLHATSRIPHIAICSVITLFCLIVFLHFVGLLSLSTLLQLAGQNFFILYGFCVVAYIKLVRTWPVRLFGFGTLLLTLLVMSTFSWGLLYPLALVAAGFLLHIIRKRAKQLAPAMVESSEPQPAPGIPYVEM